MLMDWTVPFYQYTVIINNQTPPFTVRTPEFHRFASNHHFFFFNGIRVRVAVAVACGCFLIYKELEDTDVNNTEHGMIRNDVRVMCDPNEPNER